MDRDRTSRHGVASGIMTSRFGLTSRAIGLAVMLALPLAGCSFDTGGLADAAHGAEQQASDAIDAAMNKLLDTSADWQQTLKDMESSLSDDAKKLIDNDVQNLVSNTLGQAGVTAFCGVDFLNHRVIEGLAAIKAKLLGETPPAVQPYFCSAVPASVDRSLIPSDLKVLNFYGYNLVVSKTGLTLKLVNKDGTVKDVTSSVAYPTPYEMTLNLAGNGAQLDGQSDHFAFYNGATLFSTVSVLQPAVVPKICQSSVDTVAEQTVGPYILPKVGSGDNDFDGNGPVMHGLATLIVTGQKVTLRLYGDARETKKDWTEAGGSHDYVVYTAKPNTVIDKVTTPISSSWGPLTPNGHFDTDNPFKENLGTGGLVQYVELVGDTDGDDIGKASVAAYLNKIGVATHEVGDCVSSDAVTSLLGTNFLSGALKSALTVKATADTNRLKVLAQQLRPQSHP